MPLTEPRRGSLQAGSTRLSYLEWGSDGGRAALLLHGITSNARTWWRVGPWLAKIGFRVVALDMPGHGHSGDTADHRIESIAGLAGAAAAGLAMERVLLVGHSWGGAVALALAARDPARVARVVLVDPALSLSAEAGRTRLPMFTNGIGAPADSLVPALAQANPDWHEEDVRWKAEAMQQCRADAVIGFFTESGDWDLTPMLAQVKAPLLLLLADPSATIVDAETRSRAKRRLSPESARMAVVPNTTHNMYRGAGYEPTLAVLADWLAAR